MTGRFIIFFCCLQLCLACDNDFDINGDYIEKTVVIGLLDFGLDTNFIRIGKTFLEPNTSAFVLATSPDQLFYDYNELNVYLEEWKSGVFIKTVGVDYVDGDSLGIEKEPGIFSTSPNILYRIATPLDSAATYKLFIINNNTGDTITSQTNIVQSYYVYYPTLPGTYINFADTGKITYTCKQAVNALIYELWMDFYYYEKNIYSGDSVLKKLEWQIFNNEFGDNILGYSNLSYTLPRHSFYNVLASSIEVNSDVVRTAVGVDFRWYAGGVELYDLYLNMLANLGLNEDYISPEYTNVEGGVGMFSSRHTKYITDIKFYESTIDSIACGKLTSKLNFISSKTNPAYPGCAF